MAKWQHVKIKSWGRGGRTIGATANHHPLVPFLKWVPTPPTSGVELIYLFIYFNLTTSQKDHQFVQQDIMRNALNTFILHNSNTDPFTT